jgi:hypothetical protein
MAKDEHTITITGDPVLDYIKDFDWTEYDKPMTMDDVLAETDVNWLGAGFTTCANENLGADLDDCECDDGGCCDGVRADSPKMLMSVPIEFTIVDTETGKIKQTFAPTVDEFPVEYFDERYQCKFDGETSTATLYKGCDGQYYLRMTLCAKNPEKEGETTCSKKTLKLPDPINPDLMNGEKLKKETFQVEAGIPGGMHG